jgi:hypothetical protein
MNTTWTQSRWPHWLASARVADLPTVWSNCLAGWWLGRALPAPTTAEIMAAIAPGRLVLLLAGTSALHVGWALSRAANCEAVGDVAGAGDAPARAGGLWSLAFLLPGTLLLALTGRTTAFVALALLGILVAQAALPRASALAPPFLGAARLLIYLVAASTTATGLNGWALWGGLVLGAYVAGVAMLARQVGRPGRLDLTGGLLLPAPILLALAMNSGANREGALLLAGVLGLWTARALQSVVWPPTPSLERAVAGLTAGIVFVDWLAVANAPRASGFVFLPLFLLTLFLQRALPRG